jgi:hypothetical protein
VSDGARDRCERTTSVVASWKLGAANKTARVSTEATAAARSHAHTLRRAGRATDRAGLVSPLGSTAERTPLRSTTLVDRSQPVAADVVDDGRDLDEDGVLEPAQPIAEVRTLAVRPSGESRSV